MRNLYALGVGAAAAGALTFAISKTADAALLAVIECLFIAATLIFIFRLLKRPVSPWLPIVAALVIVTYVSLTTSGTAP